MFVGAGQAAAKQQAQIIQMHYGLDGYVHTASPRLPTCLGSQAADQPGGNSCAGVAATAAHSQELRSLLAGTIKPSMSWRIDWRKSGCGGGEGAVDTTKATPEQTRAEEALSSASVGC